MNTKLTVFLFTVLGLAPTSFAADEIRIGNGTVFNVLQRAVVKIYIRDVSGTLLDTGNPAGHIRGVAFRIQPSPASAVTSMSIIRRGPCAVASNPDEIQDFDLEGTRGFNYGVYFQPQPPSFTLDAQAPGDHCFDLSVRVRRGYYGPIHLTLDPQRTLLIGAGANVEEAEWNGQLTLINGVLDGH